ncbi:hypothetical protein GGH96_004403 [Coemansia sp. RSA 1972]|nr:hypothetical protein GGH96_004403 [Coemansia sp. RSA 1972]
MSVSLPESLATFDTEYCADSLEFYPFDDTQRFVVGTYQLLKDGNARANQEELTSSDATRVGRIYVCDAIETDAGMRIIEQQQIETSAIFDIKWSYNSVGGKHLAGVACADGSLAIYSANQNDAEFLSPVCTNIASSMCCSLDWSNRRISTSTPRIVTSYSDGQLQLLELTESSLTEVCQWQGHDLEAWIAAFDYWTPDIVYSGGDDARLKGWDTRMGPHPVFNSRRHQAGVCSIQSNFHREHTLATGSYDEHVFVWDTRNMRVPVQEYNVGGGAWRLKWHPKDAALLLVGAMYNGFHVLNVGENVACLASFMDHTSIAYGADWCQAQMSGSKDIETTGIREELLRRFKESGERERMQDILRNKLDASGWQDRVKDRCQRVIHENTDTIDKLTVDDIAESVTPYARSSVPEDIKAEVLEEIRKFIYRSLPETGN